MIEIPTVENPPRYDLVELLQFDKANLDRLKAEGKTPVFRRATPAHEHLDAVQSQCSTVAAYTASGGYFRAVEPSGVAKLTYDKIEKFLTPKELQ